MNDRLSSSFSQEAMAQAPQKTTKSSQSLSFSIEKILSYPSNRAPSVVEPILVPRNSTLPDPALTEMNEDTMRGQNLENSLSTSV